MAEMQQEGVEATFRGTRDSWILLPRGDKRCGQYSRDILRPSRQQPATLTGRRRVAERRRVRRAVRHRAALDRLNPHRREHRRQWHCRCCRGEAPLGVYCAQRGDGFVVLVALQHQCDQM